MTNLLDFVSLKRNCSNRLVKSPLPSEGIVLLKDFLSPNFTEKLFMNNLQQISENSSYSQYEGLVQDIEIIFKGFKEDIDRIQATLISKAMSLFGRDRDLIEKDRLRTELKELHQRVLQSNMKQDILEEFAVMFNHCKEKINIPLKTVCKSSLETFKNFVEEIQLELKKSIQELGTKSMKELIFLPQIIPEKNTLKMKSYSVKELFYPNVRDVQGCWLELEGQSPVLCFGYRNKFGSEPLQAKLYAIEKGKLCYSIPNWDRLPHAFSKKLNSLAFCYTRYKNMTKELVVDFHRINARGVKKISEINIKVSPQEHITFGESPLLNHCHLIRLSDVRLTFINDYDLLLIKQAHKIFVINIITKKMLYEKEYPEGILDVNYLKDFGSVVILTSKNILVYKIDNRNYSLVQFYSLKITEDEALFFSSGRIVIENNIILVSLNQTFKTEPYSTCYVLEIKESRISHSTFLVLSPLNYVPVIHPAERKITLFGVLSWLGFYLKKNFTYDIKENCLKEEIGDGDSEDQKEVIYADNFRTIVQKKLECGGKKIIYGAKEYIIHK